MGPIRRSDMLHRKWHERPIRSAWKTTEEEHMWARRSGPTAQKQRGRKLGQYKERMALRCEIAVQTIKRHLDFGSRDLIQFDAASLFEVRISDSLSNSFNQSVSALSITISAQEATEIEARAAPNREKVRRMLEEYQLRRSNGDQNANGQSRCRSRKSLPATGPLRAMASVYLRQTTHGS
jgi:hypothetical protein